MVTYIPGPEALLQPAAQQLGQALATIINPNLEAQKALQLSIARNPAMLQQLADAEAAAPGTMERLGFGKLGGAIASMPSSPQMEYMIKNRQQIVKGLEAEQTAETAKNLYSSKNINDALQLITNDPSISFDAALKRATGETTAERSVSRAKGEQAAATFDALQDPKLRQIAGTLGATGMSPSEMAAEPFKVHAMNRGVEMLQQGVPITMQKFLNNEYSAEDLAAIFSTPLGDALKQQLGAYTDQLRIRVMAANDNDAMERLKMGKAFELLTKVRGGSFESAYNYLFKPEAAARAAELAKDPKLAVSPEDKALLATHQQFGQFDDAQRRVELSALSRDMVALRGAFQGTYRPKDQGGAPGAQGDSQREMLVSQINEVLRQRTLFGAPQYTASYEMVPRSFAFDKKELVFKDAQGKVVTEDMVNAPILAAPPSPTTGGGTLPAAPGLGQTGAVSAPGAPAGVNAVRANGLNVQGMKQAYDKLSAGEKKAQVARWMAEAKSDAQRQTIQQLFGNP